MGPMVETSVGMLFASLAISDTKSVGTQERASGESGVSCSFLDHMVQQAKDKIQEEFLKEKKWPVIWVINLEQC